MRQLLVGLMVVLSGNARVGGIAQDIDRSLLMGCDCERQFQCFTHPVNFRFNDGKGNMDQDQPQFGLCPRWKRNHLDASFPTYGGDRQFPTQNGNAVIITDFEALHHSFQNPERRIERHIKDLQERYGDKDFARGSLIPMTIHWPGPNKPQVFNSSQGQQAVETYNSMLRTLAKENDLWVLETYSYTHGEYSRDGVHYDDENIALAQILLNYISHAQKKGRIPSGNATSQMSSDVFASLSPEDAYKKNGFSLKTPFHGPFNREHFNNRSSLA